MKYDSVIIGSGISGLTAALTLAQNGQKVALIEKTGHLAPLLRRFKRGNVWCDPGFHYSGGFEESGSLSVILHYLGIGQKIEAIPMRSDCYDELIMENERISLASGFNGVRDSLSKYFPQDSKAIQTYIDKIKLIMDETPFINFDLAFSDFSRISDEGMSLFDFLDSVNASEKLKRLLSRYGLYLYGVEGDEVPFHIHALVMGSFYKSPYTLAGGGDAIVDAFQERLVEEGVDYFCNTAATGLKIDEKRQLQGVYASNDKLFEAPNCIFTAHPQLLKDIFPKKAVRPAYLARLEDMKNTQPFFTLYLELDEIPEKLHHTNIYRLSSVENSLNDILDLAIMCCDPGTYKNKKKGLCILASTKSDMIAHISYGEKKRTSQYLSYKKKLTNEALQEIIKICPDLENKYKVVASATSFTYQRYTSTIGGAPYGLKQSTRQMKLGPLTSVLGFYLAGQSILMPGIMGAAISGLIGASNIIGMEYLWNEVRKCR